MAILHLRPLIAAALLFSAGTAKAWTDAGLTPGVTRVRAVHLSEIVVAANAKLVSCGLSPAGAQAIGTVIRAADVNATRTSVNTLYLSFAQPVPQYTDGAMVADRARIRAVYISELRAAVDAAASWPCPP